VESSRPQAQTHEVAERPKGRDQRGVARSNRQAALLALGQAKLEVGAADDVFEREADQMADRVVAALGTPGGSGTADAAGQEQPVVQRIQRVQRKEVGPEVGADGGPISDGVEQQITAARSGGSALSAAMRAPMESAFGSSFGDVKVHTGAESDRLNDSVAAKAFTVGSDIFFKGGMPDTSGSSGQKLLAHELTHVVQQRGGQAGGAQRVQRLKNPFKNLFGGKKKDKDTGDPAISGPTEVKTTTDDGLVGIVRAADTDTRAFMAKDPKFMAKVDKLEEPSKSTVMELLKVVKVVEPTPVEVQPVPQSEPIVDPEVERLRLAQLEVERLAAVKLEEERVKAAEEERQRIATEDLRYNTTAEINLLKIPALLTYVEQTPAWHQRSTITALEKIDLRAIIAFGLEPGAASALGGFSVADITGATTGPLGGTLSDAISDLRQYVAGVSKNDPIALDVAATAAAARTTGNAMKKLLTGFPAWVLRSALTQHMLGHMIKMNWVDDTVAYYTTSLPQPIFQATSGGDFGAYINARYEGWNPLDYHTTSLQGKIRNFHRFRKDALDQLKDNFAAGNSANLPLTLVLHTAVDHNGAFHRDPLLSNVITDPNSFALLIEGGESLGDYQSQIGPIATQYGVHGKLDQVMFAGHGNSKLIEMAGTIAESSEGTVKEQGEAVDIVGGKTAADALFDEVLNNMASDGDTAAQKLLTPGATTYRRVLFNACLTNSNSIDMTLDDDNSTAQTEIVEYLRNNASLATYLANKAAAQDRGGVKSLGANASIGQVELIDSSGALNMVSTADPFVTASKLEYAEHGKEPLGVLRAALEAWGADPVAASEAMTRRSLVASTKWDDVIISSIYRSILAKGNDPGLGQMFQVWAEMAAGISEMKSDAHCKVSEMSSWVENGWSSEIDTLLGGLQTSSEWGANASIRLVMYQLWLGSFPSDGTLPGQLLGVLESDFTAKTAMVADGKYVDVPYLVGRGVFDTLLDGPSAKGKTVLALVGLLDGGAPAKAKEYFTSRLEPGAAEVPELPEVPEVAAILEQAAPRPKVAKVPKVLGRAKTPKIDGKRAEFAAVADLEELPELAEVAAVRASGPVTKEGVAPTVVAPGRKGRPKRELVPKIPAVKPYLPARLDFATLIGSRATEDEIVAKLN